VRSPAPRARTTKLRPAPNQKNASLAWQARLARNRASRMTARWLIVSLATSVDLVQRRGTQKTFRSRLLDLVHPELGVRKELRHLLNAQRENSRSSGERLTSHSVYRVHPATCVLAKATRMQHRRSKLASSEAMVKRLQAALSQAVVSTAQLRVTSSWSAPWATTRRTRTADSASSAPPAATA